MHNNTLKALKQIASDLSYTVCCGCGWEMVEEKKIESSRQI